MTISFKLWLVARLWVSSRFLTYRKTDDFQFFNLCINGEILILIQAVDNLFNRFLKININYVIL